MGMFGRVAKLLDAIGTMDNSKCNETIEVTFILVLLIATSARYYVPWDASAHKKEAFI